MPQRAVTLIGMSGVGKTHNACKLEELGWRNYSGDYVIGSKFLKHELESLESFSPDNIEILFDYLGRPGNPDQGGFPLQKFRRRQKTYYYAECLSLDLVEQEIEDTDKNFVHDSTGSLCEIRDEELMEQVGQQTLFVYLKASEEIEKTVLQRAFDEPKPLYFPKDFLMERVNEFVKEQGANSIEDINPDDFSRWVFPKLFESRKPKYQKLADMYGVTIPAKEFENLQSSEEFIDIVARYLDEQN